MIRVNGFTIDEKRFPDNTLSIKLDPNKFRPFFGESDYLIEWYYEDDAELFTLYCIRRHLDGYSAKLFMPYCPNARMDRVQNEEDIFTLRSFAENINDMNFSSVEMLDVHSNVAMALILNSKNISPKPYIETALEMDKTVDMLFFPDEGAMKRYGSMELENYMGQKIPYIYGVKNRSWTTGIITGLTVVNPDSLDLKGKNILIVDDICSKGGTFYHSATKLKELGAGDISLYATHCENNILNGKIFKTDLINKVYSTQSIIHEKELYDKLEYVWTR